MAREQLGVAPSINAHTSTKAYVDSGSKTLTNTNLTAPTISDPNVTGALKFEQFADSAGRLIGSTAVSGICLYMNNSAAGQLGKSHVLFIANVESTNSTQTLTIQRPNAAGAYILFQGTGGTTGGIGTTNGTTTYYNTSSDYRLKQNVTDLGSGTETIAALRPVKYEWKFDGSYGEGFLAHELQDVIPEAVVGEKDAVDSEGEIIPQGVDLAKVVPHLVAAVQELTAKLEAAEERITALEAASNTGG